jgi:hypothetical protein
MVRVFVNVSNTGSEPLFSTFGTNAVTNGNPFMDCRVTGAGTEQCMVEMPRAQTTTFTARPNSGDSFARWSQGPCAGSTAVACTFTTTGDAFLTAVFNAT